jgi:peptidoglycan/LPS O-acetylase OafA/YrhL
MIYRVNILVVTCLLLLLSFSSCVATTNGYGYGYMQPVILFPGIGLGTIIAVVVSWNRNKSILWAIIHGFLGWLYVIYAIIVKD